MPEPLVWIVDPIHPAGAERLSAVYEVITPERGVGDPRIEAVTHIVIRTTELPETMIARMPGRWEPGRAFAVLTG